MNPTFRGHKRVIRAFLATVTDERLMLLERKARAGELRYVPVCECLVGVALGLDEYLTSLSAWQARLGGHTVEPPASAAFGRIASDTRRRSDALRNRIVLPMVRAEIARRARALTAESETCEMAHA